jgi:hypothetical protein
MASFRPIAIRNVPRVSASLKNLVVVALNESDPTFPSDVPARSRDALYGKPVPVASVVGPVEVLRPPVHR